MTPAQQTIVGLIVVLGLLGLATFLLDGPFWVFFLLAFPLMSVVGCFLGGTLEGLIFGRDRAQSSVGRLNGRGA